MLSGLILIGRGLDRKGKRAWKKKNYCLVLSVLKTLGKKNLVMIAWWTHLYPFRTQKLSIIAAKIVHCAKIARCQFLLFFYVFTWSLTGHALVVWLFFLICVIASYKIEIILSCYYLMFINLLKLFEYLDFLYELLFEISKKKDIFSRPLLLGFILCHDIWNYFSKSCGFNN